MKSKGLIIGVVFFACQITFAANYYVATNGNDNNAGTIDLPFATIQKAADIMSAGDTCYIRGGTYRQTVIISRSGSSGNPIKFTSYQNEIVILDGTDVVSASWAVHSGSIYKATMNMTVEQVFVDEDMMVEARWPNISGPDGVFSNSTWAKVDSGSLGTLTDSSISGTGINWVGAYGAFNISQQMHTWVRKVKTQNNNTITYDTNGIDTGLNGTWSDDRYYLFGKLAALDTAKEWFYDSEATTLYLWTPDGDSPANHIIEIKQRNYGFDSNADIHDITVCGLNFFGCEVSFDPNCSYITIDNCNFVYPNYSRLIPTMYSGGNVNNSNANLAGHHLTVTNCHIENALMSGIFLKGAYITFKDNLVHDVLWNGSNTFAAVLILPNSDANAPLDEGNSLISNNTVYNSGNVAIKVMQKDSIIQYNDLSQGGLASKDTTLLYTANSHPNMIWQYNWIHDTESFAGNGLGLRLDGNPDKVQVDHVTIKGNVAWNCSGRAFTIKGVQHDVYNNTVLGTIALMYNTHQNTELYNNYASEFTFTSGATSGGVGYYGYNSSTTTPKFENTADCNFIPKTDSVLMNSGTSSRPGYSWIWNGSAPEKGAYERYEPYWVAGSGWARDPSPADNQAAVDVNSNLEWRCGMSAVSCDVYLGTSYDAVAQADHSFAEYKGNQTATTYDLGTLNGNTIYYWAIDDVNGTQVWHGQVWSFTTAAGPEDATSFPCIGDTWVRQNGPSENHGSDTYVQHRATSQYAYLKFTVSDLGGAIISAKLKIRSGGNAINNTFVCPITGTWNESTLTWNNDNLTWGSVLATKNNIAASSWYEFDVTSAVTGDGTYSFGLKTTQDEGGLNWSSRESIYSPVLLVTTDEDKTAPTPNPMSFSSIPTATGTSTITMTAATATDTAGVQYCFEEVSGNPYGGGNTSGWQDSASWTDNNLYDGNEYTYRVMARDKSINNNETAWSGCYSATTWIRYYTTSYSVTQGSYSSGDFESLKLNDDTFFVVASQTSGTTRYATTDFTITGVLFPNIPDFNLRVISKSNKSSTTQKLSLWNYSTSSWDEKDSATIGTSEVTRDVDVITGASNYISDGTMKVRVKTSHGSSASFNFSHEMVRILMKP